MNTYQEGNRSYEFTHLELCKEDFQDLVFMNPPEIKEWDNSWLVELCAQPLAKVVKDVIQQSSAKPDEGAAEVFRKLYIRDDFSRGESWFEKHEYLSACFDKRLMPALWIRNLSPLDGKPQCGAILSNEDLKLYIDDGNTRALVYAVRLACGEERFEPIKAIHATSWDFTKGILGHQPQLASELYFEGEFQSNLSPETKIGKRIRWNRMTNKFTQKHADSR